MRQVEIPETAPSGIRKQLILEEIKRLWEDYQYSTTLLSTLEIRLDAQYRLIYALAAELEMLPDEEDKNIPEHMD